LIVLVRQGTKFGPEYVAKLANQVRDRVVTLTDQPDTPGETRALKHGWPGWWAKLELFSPEHDGLKPFTFLDLDTFVFGEIPDYEDRFLMIRDFNFPNKRASGVMRVSRETRVWEHFLSRPRQHMDVHAGDQDYLGPFADGFLPMDGIRSYKKHCRDGPKGTIMCFHGRPKPHECTGWAKEYWDAA